MHALGRLFLLVGTCAVMELTAAGDYRICLANATEVHVSSGTCGSRRFGIGRSAYAMLWGPDEMKAIADDLAASARDCGPPLTDARWFVVATFQACHVVANTTYSRAIKLPEGPRPRPRRRVAPSANIMDDILFATGIVCTILILVLITIQCN